jgi:N-acetyl-alpha-D-glucosaminyl L-malate synthase BshA
VKIGITCYPSTGGSGVLASELGKFLAQRGHSVHFITLGVPYRLRDEYRENLFFHTVELEPYPLFEHPPHDLALAAKMCEVAAAESLDLLHVHYAVPHAINAYLAAQMSLPRRLPIVTTLHGTDITLVGQQKHFYEITRFGINRSNAVTAVSDYLKRRTEEIFRPERAIRRVYNFVDPALFHKRQDPCHRSSFSNPGQVVYMHLSNFRPIKRVEDVVRVFAAAAEKVDGVLVMVGEGPTLRTARELAAELGVGARLRFLGNQLDVPSILGCGDIFLFPSELESFGLAPLEAMACEMPVIASNSGGIPEVVAQGETGFLAEPGDLKRMAEQALRLGLDPELRRRMGAAGRKRAETVFSPEAALRQYEAVYADAIADAGRN